MFSKRLEAKWEQRFDALGQLARSAGVQNEDIEAVRSQQLGAAVAAASDTAIGIALRQAASRAEADKQAALRQAAMRAEADKQAALQQAAVQAEKEKRAALQQAAAQSEARLERALREAEEEKLDNWDNKEFVLNEMMRHGVHLECASERLMADKEVVLTAVRQDGRALCYAAEHLLADKEVVLAAVKQNGWSLRFAAKSVQADKEVVLAAVQQDGMALSSAARSLYADVEVVRAAVEENARSLDYVLDYASDDLFWDEEVLRSALGQQYPIAIECMIRLPGACGHLEKARVLEIVKEMVRKGET